MYVDVGRGVGLKGGLGGKTVWMKRLGKDLQNNNDDDSSDVNLVRYRPTWAHGED